MLFLAVKWPIFHAARRWSTTTRRWASSCSACALPALTLVLVIVAHMMRMTRAAIINLLASPYIEMARLKGMPPARVIWRHALPNAWAPIVTVIALNLAYLIVGVVVVEVVFVYPGIGQLMVDAVADARHAGGAGLRADLRRAPTSCSTSSPTSSASSPTRACCIRDDRLDRPRARRRAAAARRAGSRAAGARLRKAPLTARFGMLVILLYVVAALFAPLHRALRRGGGGRRPQYEPWGDEVPARHRPARPRHADRA